MKFLKLGLVSGLIACTSAAMVTPTLAGQNLATPEQPVLVTQSPTQPRARLRVAVLDFEFASTGASYPAGSFFGRSGPEKGVSDLLTNALVNSGQFTVIERSRIDAILQEQNLGMSGRVDAATAADVGRILGVDVVILGSITRFNVGTSGGNVNIGIFGGGSNQSSAEVALTARMINTSTAEILSVAQGSGNASQGGGGFRLGRIGFGNQASNPDALLSDAAEEAVANLVQDIISRN